MAGRLTSSIFVSAVIRRVNGAGGFATVLRRGSDEAGAIFVCVPGERGQGTALYGQVPQSVFAEKEDTAAGGRLFEQLAEGLSQDELDSRFEREARLDPDFWVIELELFGRPLTDFIETA